MILLKKILYLSLAVVTAAFLTIAFAAEKPGGDKKGKQSLEKGAGVPRYQILNINNITTWAQSNGESNHSPGGDNGVYYPVGTGNVVYEDGIVFGSKLFLDAAKTQQPSVQPIRVGGGTYLSNVGTKPGYVTGVGAAAVAADVNAADVRYYRVRRDYASMTDGELRFDAQTSYELARLDQVTTTQVEAIRAQYELDWSEWPVAKGAPYIDRNNNGVYDPPPPFGADFTVDSLISGNYDEPGVAGADPSTPADQVMWTVYNDLDRAQSLRFEGSNPTGLEIQVTSFAYKRTDALGNVYFKRLRITNKGGVDIGGGQTGAFYLDSVHVCQWSDIDLGDAFDDLAGCDTTRSLGFIYNALPVDGTFVRFGLPPPCSGYDFLAGPLIPGEPTDSAVVNFKRVYGKKNLPMTGFSYFSAGSPYSDPVFNNYDVGTGRWWNMLRGFAPLGTIAEPPKPYNYPPATGPSKFPLSGDPVTQTGWVDGLSTDYSFVTGDRRILLNTGPFTLDPGETQELYIGFVVGMGADRLSSVAVMKANDNAVQETFDLLFRVAKPPASPVVKVSEMDREVFLEWSSNGPAVAATETRVVEPGSYHFEGYNVYQFPSPGARISDGVRLATYDVVNDIKVVLSEQFDLRAAAFLKVPIQFGGDNGVKRYFKLDKDNINDINTLYNGQEYYVAVTAYSYSSLPGYLAALESSPNIITVRPKVPFGKVFTAQSGDTLDVTKAGVSDGKAVPIVLDPGSTTGDTYEIQFSKVAGVSYWKVVDKTKNTTVIADQTNQSGDEAYPVLDGVLVKVFGAPDDFKEFQCVANGTGPLADPDMGAFGFNSSGFPYVRGFDRPQVRNITGGGLWGIHTGSTSSFSYDYFKTRTARGDNWSQIVPNDFEIRFTAAGGKAQLYYTNDKVIDVPFELWFIGSGTPSDASDDVRMIPWLYDTDGDDAFNLNKTDHPISGGTDDPQTDWIYWRFPANMAPGQAGYNAWVSSAPAETDVGPEVMARMVLVNWNGGNVAAADWPANVNQVMPAAGTIFRINSTKPNTPTVTFSYTTPAPLVGTEQEKLSAENVGVFPNPYYASNIGESSRFDRYVTFNNLPKVAKIRIFNLAGHLVRVLDKDDNSQFTRWDLMNMRNYPVASGVYIAYVDMPDLGSTKILKFAVIQEQEILDRY